MPQPLRLPPVSISDLIPNVEVIDQDGNRYRFFEDLIRGKTVMINFMYVKCEELCPMQTMNLAHVQKLLGDRVGRDIFMYSITLKPYEDSPEALREYMRAHQIGPGWKYLTSTDENIETLRQGLGFTDPDPIVDADTSNHIGIVRYGVEPLSRWGGCPAISAPEFIVRNVLSLTGPAVPLAPGPV